MKVKRYIEMIKGVEGSIDTVIAILKESGATEGEAVLALMVTREMSMDEAQAQIAKGNDFPTHNAGRPGSGRIGGTKSKTKTGH